MVSTGQKARDTKERIENGFFCDGRIARILSDRTVWPLVACFIGRFRDIVGAF